MLVRQSVPRLLEPPRVQKGLQAIAGLPGVKRRVLAYGGKDSWRTDDGIEVMSPMRFVDAAARGF